MLVEEYLRHLDEDKGRKHSTLVRYRGLARTWVSPALGSARVSRLLPSDVEKLLGEMRRARLSQSSIHQTFTLLSGAFKWARRNRRIAQNPLVEVQEPRSAVPAREVMPPDLPSLLLLLSTALEEEYDTGVALHLGAATGMRRGELAGLRCSRLQLPTPDGASPQPDQRCGGGLGGAPAGGPGARPRLGGPRSFGLAWG